VFAVTDIL